MIIPYFGFDEGTEVTVRFGLAVLTSIVLTLAMALTFVDGAMDVLPGTDGRFVVEVGCLLLPTPFVGKVCTMGTGEEVLVLVALDVVDGLKVFEVVVLVPIEVLDFVASVTTAGTGVVVEGVAGGEGSVVRGLSAEESKMAFVSSLREEAFRAMAKVSGTGVVVLAGTRKEP